MCAHVQEYMRQVRLEEIIRDSQQAALREKAMEMLAHSRHLGVARGGPAAYFGAGGSAPPTMNPFQQQHLQHQLLQVSFIFCTSPFSSFYCLSCQMSEPM